jgi:hypothetical protein
MDSILGLILMIHWAVRFAIIVVAVIAILKLAYDWQAKRTFDGMDRGLTAGYSGLMDAQALLGIVVLLGGGLTSVGFPAYRIVHAAVMIIAVVVAHLPMRWKSAADPVRLRNNLLAVVCSLLIVFAGLVLLSAGKG